MASTDQPTASPEQPNPVEPSTDPTDSPTLDAGHLLAEPTQDRLTERELPEPQAPEPEAEPEADSGRDEPPGEGLNEPESSAPEPAEPESAQTPLPAADLRDVEPAGRNLIEPEQAESEPLDVATTTAGPEAAASAETGALEVEVPDMQASSGSEVGTAPAARRRRKSAALPAPVDDPPAAADESDPGDRKSDRLAAPFQPPDAPHDDPTGEDPFEQAVRPTATSLLFQAPQPVLPASPQEPAEPAADRSGQPAATPPSGTSPSAARQHSAQLAEEPSDDEEERSGSGPRRRRRGGKGRRSSKATVEPNQPSDDEGADAETGASGPGDPSDAADEDGQELSTRRRTRRRRRNGSAASDEGASGVVTKVREPRREGDGVVALRGSTRLEAKKQRRREGREAGRRRVVLTEAEYLARRESVERVMLVRRTGGRTQIAVLEDGVLVEHYISRDTNASMAGNIYVGRVQNVLPSMEAAFVDIGKGRNAVLYAGEVNWDAAGLESGQAKRIENALEPGQSVLVQVTKDPVGHKGARLTSQVSLPGRYLVYVPDSAMTGISRKLPDVERARLKRILRDVVPESAGVIVRTAAEGATEAELRSDVERLTATWEQIRGQVESLSRKAKGSAPAFLHGEPDLTVRVVRDIFNEDFASLVVSGEAAWAEVSDYVAAVAPDLTDRLSKWTGEQDLFAHHRVDEQIAKAMDRKVWLPSGGSLVIDRTEAMTVVDVNTGKFVGSGGNLEETVTRNNIEAAEEIVRQLRLRDIGGIIVIDFIDMVLESNRDLVVRRLLECLGRDRTKHQVAEVTSLGLVQMTRKRVGAGLLEVFSQTCEHCNGRGYLIHSEPNDQATRSDPDADGRATAAMRPPQPAPGSPTPAQIAAAAHAAAVKKAEEDTTGTAGEDRNAEQAVAGENENVVAPSVSGAGSGDEPAAATTQGASGPDAPERRPSEADEAPGAGERVEADEAFVESESPAADEAPRRGEGSQAGEAVFRRETPETSDASADSGPFPDSEDSDVVAGSSPVGEAADAGEESDVVAGSSPVGEAADAGEASPAGEGSAAVPARRRRHGRVVAPAGPPRASL